jgi:hypothetical protein
MADRKISDLTTLTTPASGDYLPIVDISETAASSKNKRITIEELMRGAPDGTAAAPGIAFESDPNTGIYSPGADQVAISTNGTGRLFVDASGNVGLGTSSPSGKLTVSYTSTLANPLADANAGLALIGSSTVRTLFGSDPSSPFGAYIQASNTGAAFPLLLNPSGGSVGINTTNPTSKLAIHTTPNTTALGITDETASDFLITPGVSSGVCRVGPATGAMALYAAGSERARIDSSGRVLIGTSSDSGGALLQVNGDRVRIATAKTPASSGATGTTGEIAWDADYIYVCTATNTWKRAAIGTW